MFRTYVRDVLAPGDIVGMDNLASQKVGVREAIESAAAGVWYLPYSPDLNPMERMWSKVKALVRKAKTRSASALYDALVRCCKRCSSGVRARPFSFCFSS